MIRIYSFTRAVISTVMSTAFFSLALLAASTAVASASALLEFSETLKSFRASFTQTVYDSDSVVLQESTGVVVLARPGRFKWTYDAPINQIIVADGLTLWVYDEEIKQVTKQPQSTTLGSAPIGLLSGQRDIESEFVITELGKKDDLEWFQLQPLVSDTDFNDIFLALKNDGLHAMELRDNFDQATQIVFSDFEKNISVDSEQFNFVVPEGVDVVGEGGVADTQDELLNDESPKSTEQGETESSTDTVPAALSSTDAPVDSVILPTDDTDPLLDDISTTELQDDLESGDTDPASPAASTGVESNPQDSGNEQSGTTEADVKATGTQEIGTANSDDELLGDTLLAEPADPLIQPEVEEAPLIDTADPTREITFEEQKVTE